jgi:hypothetical protein
VVSKSDPAWEVRRRDDMIGRLAAQPVVDEVAADEAAEGELTVLYEVGFSQSSGELANSEPQLQGRRLVCCASVREGL